MLVFPDPNVVRIRFITYVESGLMLMASFLSGVFLSPGRPQYHHLHQMPAFQQCCDQVRFRKLQLSLSSQSSQRPHQSEPRSNMFYLAISVLHLTSLSSFPLLHPVHLPAAHPPQMPLDRHKAFSVDSQAHLPEALLVRILTSHLPFPLRSDQVRLLLVRYRRVQRQLRLNALVLSIELRLAPHCTYS